MTVSQIDNVLHSERTTRAGEKRNFDARLSELPLGAMFEHEGRGYLVAARGCLQRFFGGYSTPNHVDGAATVKVLTPPSMLRVFANGFAPTAHPSADECLPSRRVSKAP